MALTRANFERDLIFDVGACHGDDSAYYLHKGYRVVAVEPQARLAAQLRERFAEAVLDARLMVVEAAIAASEGAADFWVCEDVPGWSSFDVEIAGYRESRHHRATVRTVTLASLLERFGVPFYLKIDIEGSDGLCLDQLSPAAVPPFVSVELPTIGRLPPESEVERMMARLEQLGYRRFKVISQVTYRPMPLWLAHLKARIPERISERVTMSDAWLRKIQCDDDWRFGAEASGPFGDASPGVWLDGVTARKLIAAIQRNRDYSDWFDIHAALGPEAIC